MRSIPIAQYLNQKSRSGEVDWPAARREPMPFKPKAAPALVEPVDSNDTDEETRPKPTFRRSGLLAAVAARPNPIAERSQARAEIDTPRRESVFFRKSEPAPGPDIETRLAEAYHRGVQEGLDSAREENAAARASERAELQKLAMVERLDFQMIEYAKLAETISRAMGEIEQRIADRVARILQPFVAQAISGQAIEALARDIARLRQAGRPGLIRIRGPERLLGALKQKVAALAIDVEYGVEEGVDVIVEANDTTIRTALQSWADVIGAFAEQD